MYIIPLCFILQTQRFSIHTCKICCNEGRKERDYLSENRIIELYKTAIFGAYVLYV